MLKKYIALGVMLSTALLSFNCYAQDRYQNHNYKRNVVVVKKTNYERYRAANYGYSTNYPRSHYRRAGNNERVAYYGHANRYGRDISYRRSSHYNNYSDYQRGSNREREYDSDNDYDADYDSNSNDNVLGNSPFPSKISSSNIIKVDLGKLAWGAYDDGGNLVKWGRASGGKNYCPDINRGCKTVTGTYTIYRKQGPECKSNRFPVGKGGAPMPYCMHFHGGYAMHGGQVPNYNASHGCVRLLHPDAEWLNEDFVRVGSTRVNITY